LFGTTFGKVPVHTLSVSVSGSGNGVSEVGKVDEIEVYNRALTPTEVSWMARGIPAEAPRTLDEVSTEDRATYVASHDTKLDAIRKELQDARFAVAAAEDSVREVLAMEEMPGIRPTYVLARGAYDAPKTPDRLVSRKVPAFLPQIPPLSHRDWTLPSGS